MPERLHFMIRTPHELLLDVQLLAARVPSQSGQVGLRAHAEPMMLVVEPGLIVLRGAPEAHQLAASAGGLLDVQPARAVLFTPFAALGADAAELLSALERAFAVPDSELSVRRKLGDLEQRIVRELSQRSLPGRAGGTA